MPLSGFSSSLLFPYICYIHFLLFIVSLSAFPLTWWETWPSTDLVVQAVKKNSFVFSQPQPKTTQGREDVFLWIHYQGTREGVSRWSSRGRVFSLGQSTVGRQRGSLFSLFLPKCLLYPLPGTSELEAQEWNEVLVSLWMGLWKYLSRGPLDTTTLCPSSSTSGSFCLQMFPSVRIICVQGDSLGHCLSEQKWELSQVFINRELTQSVRLSVRWTLCSDEGGIRSG